MFDLHLFGGAALADEGGPVGGRASQRRRLALLVLLARAGPPGLARERLASFLWPEAGPVQSRHLLADSLYVLRSALGKDALMAVGENVRLDPRVVDCDVTRFEAAVAGGELERAVDLYAGDFLDGFFISGAPEFERWVSTERDRLARAYADALTALGTSALERGDMAAAAGWLRRAAERQPENSRVVLDLMGALVACGDRAQAIARADRHEAYLRTELDAEADPIVAEYARRLRADGEAWEAPPHPLAAPQRRGAIPEKRWTRASKGILLGIGIVLALALLAGGRLLLRTSIPLPPEEAPTDGTDPAIAVLPFRVNDSALATWREGMVDLLSVNLDGVPGLRAIDNRTVLARWGEAVPDTAPADLTTALRVARNTSARYALVGSVVVVGPNLRLTADVYETRGASRLGRGQVTGAPDSILVLVDRLTREVLQVLPREGNVLAQVDLAELTTDSLAALKAYLRGEALYRRANFEEAGKAFVQAIEADSTFALALYRIRDVCLWGQRVDDWCERVPLTPSEHWPPEFVRRLPRRKQEQIAASRDEHGDQRRIEALRRLVRKYPDDPDAWYTLGDGLFNMAGPDLRAEAVRALERSIALAPAASMEPYIHLIEVAIDEGDSARVARLLDDYDRGSRGKGAHLFAYRLAFGLAFGDSLTRAQTRASMGSMATEDLWYAHAILTRRASLLKIAFEVLHVAVERPDIRDHVGGPVGLAYLLFRNGSVHAALREINESPEVPPADRANLWFMLNEMRILDFSPDELERVLAAGAADSIRWMRPNLLFVGVYALDRGRQGQYAAALDQERARSRRLEAEGDIAGARESESVVRSLQGYALWKRGQKSEAIRVLESALPLVGSGAVQGRVNFWLGELYLEAGRAGDAVSQFGTILDFPPAFIRLGKAYEDLGEHAKARESYERALVYWQNGDPEVRPFVEAARRARARLSAQAHP